MLKYPEINELADKKQLQGEVWKDIKGFEGYYQVSNIGRIKSLGRYVESSNQNGDFKFFKEEKILAVNNDSKGYPQITLRKDSRQRRVARVHRIVAENFLHRPEGCDIVHHRNNDPNCPNKENLEWTTLGGNMTYAWEDGIKIQSKGMDSALQKHDQAKVAAAYLLSKFKMNSQESIGDFLDMPQITVSNIKTKKTWQHLTNQIDEIFGLDFEE